MGYSSLVSSSTPFFLSTVAPDHQQMEFKKLTGTRAHEARVLRWFQQHFNAQNFQTQNLTVSIKLSQTPTLKVFEKKDPLSRTHSEGFSRFLKVSDKLSQTPTIKLSQTPTKLSQTPTLKVSQGKKMAQIFIILYLIPDTVRWAVETWEGRRAENQRTDWTVETGD